MMTSNPDVPDSDWIADALTRFEEPLIRYALRFTRDIEQARDVVQDTFLRLCRADRAEVEGRLAPWLYTVCRNRALDIYRKEHRMDMLGETMVAVRADAAPAPEVVVERRDAHRRALAVLNTLTKNQQEVVRLKFQAGLSYREISEVTGLSVSNIGYLIHTAIHRLRAQMADEAAAEPRSAS